MWIIIVIVIVIVVLFLLFGGSWSSNSNNRNSSKVRYRASGQSTSSRSAPRRPVSRQPVQQQSGQQQSAPAKVTHAQIQRLYNAQDKQVLAASQRQQQQRVLSNVRSYQQRPSRTVNTANNQNRISIDLSWAENLDELIEVTGVLYTNAEMTSNSRLESERFEYYRDLHFRSFTAANMCQSKINEMKPSYTTINDIVHKLNTEDLHVSDEAKHEIIQIKDGMKATLAFLKKRRDDLNRQTSTLRDKIGAECGRGGAVWYERIMAKHGS